MGWGKAARSRRTRMHRVGYMAMMAIVAAGPVAAEEQAVEPVRPLPASLAQATDSQAFDIPAQPLGTALVRFSEATGIQLFMDSTVARGLQSPGVRGTMTRQEALNQLLSGSGLIYRFTNATTVAVERPGAAASPGSLQLDPVRVQASAPPPQAEIGNLPRPYAGGEVARGQRIGLLGNRDYMDTPFSGTSYTEKYIEAQQSKTIIEVVQDDPTIRPFFAQGAWNDTLIIRGFTSGSASLGGLYGVAPDFALPMAGIERVEIFRGPSGMLNGFASSGAVGGTVNLVPKRATDEPINRVTGMYTSSSQLGIHADFGRRFGPDNAAGIRLNAYYNDGKTTANLNNDQLLNLTAGFDFRGTDTRLDADVGWMQRNINGLRSEINVTPGLQIPAAPSSYNNASQPWQFYDSNSVYGALRLEHDFTPATTAYLKVGGQRSTGNVFIGFPTIVNAMGATTSTSNRAIITSEYVSSEVGVRTRFETGPMRHEPVVNGTYLLTNTYSVFTPFAGPFVSNIYSPIVQPTPNYFNANTNPPQTSQTLQTSIGLIDNIFLANDRIQLLVGARLQRIQVSNYANGIITAATPGNDQSAVTPTFAFVVRPIEKLSFYGNYIQALEPGPIAGPTVTNAGQSFPPFLSDQWELGAKIDLGTFGATLSAFSITKPSAIIDAATNSLTLNGKQRNQGIEFTMFGEPLPGLKPIGGFSLMSPILLNTTNGTNNGKIAPGLAGFQANVGVDWDTPFVKGLSVSGRLVYTGQSYYDAANTQSVPAWTRVDLGASYTFERPGDRKPITLRANVLNVGNANYWMSTTQGTLTQSAARTFYLSLVADF